jgi:hypothetical protein
MNWVVVSNMDHYDIRLRPQGSTSWSILINNIQGNFKTKTGLSSSTTYEWQIRSACSSDSSSYLLGLLCIALRPINSLVLLLLMRQSRSWFYGRYINMGCIGWFLGICVRYKRLISHLDLWYMILAYDSYALIGLSIGTFLSVASS